jgi:tetratricopeptide (TPR) repeat protein
MDRIDRKARAALICALLGAATLAALWPVVHGSFTFFDDDDYIVNNPHVRGGLSWANAVWAFSTGYQCNWHPLTWLSHILDVELFGMRPGWHHFGNLVLHTANSLLLFLLLEGLTRAPWRSALVAAWFALHPLHVESVAWVAERKDVLSTLFFLLTLMAYARYVRGLQAAECPKSEVRNPKSEGNPKPEIRSAECEARSPQFSIFNFQCALRAPKAAYVLSLALFALGLMSKPMLVTLPFVLLLLDYWPLGRFGLGVPASLAAPAPSDESGPRISDFGLRTSHFGFRVSDFLRISDFGLRTSRRLPLELVLEKIPFFCLALGSCIVTYVVQQKGHAIVTALLPVLPLPSRVANAIASYWKYLGKTVWPVDLAVFYQHPDLCYPSRQWPAGMIAVGALLLALVSLYALARLRRRPWLAVGWFWYVGTLVPVIGLVQVGSQAMADRYTYVPLIGIFVAVVWGVAEAAASYGLGRWQLAAAGLASVAACGLLARKQAGYWRDDYTLFAHDLAVIGNNPVGHFHLAINLKNQGKYSEALAYLQKAREEAPDYAPTYRAAAGIWEALGDLPVAVLAYQDALRLAPGDDWLCNRLGELLWKLGRREEALERYRQALRLKPDSAQAHYNLGLALLELGQKETAAEHLSAAARLGFRSSDALARLVETLLEEGRLSEAEARCQDWVRAAPASAQARINLGVVLWRRGRAADAIAQYSQAVRLNPGLAVAHFDLGTAWSSLGRFEDAAAEFATASKLKPDYLEALTGWGRALAGQGKFKEAQAPFEQAARLCPTNVEVQLYLASALQVAGQSNQAATVFATALRLDPKLAAKTVQAGRALAAQGQVAGAMARFTTALWLKPDDPDAHEGLGLLLKQQGKAQEGESHLREAARLRGR